MKNAIVLIAALLCGAAAVPAADTPAATRTTLTFDAALRRALEVNNQVEQSKQEIVAAQANRGYLRSAILPHLAVNGTVQRNSIERTFGTAPNDVTILPLNNWNYQITLTQPVFAGLRELRAYSQATLGVDNAIEGSRETQDQILVRVASSYLSLVNAEALKEVERKNIELATTRLKQAQAFFNAGEVTKVDVLRAQTAIKAEQRALAAAQLQRDTAESDLRVQLELDGPIDALPPNRALPAIPDEASLVAKAQAVRPEVKMATNDVSIAQLEVKKQKGFALPTVYFNGGLLNQKSAFPAQNYGFGALQFSIPIFQSGEVQNRVAEARAKELQARYAMQTVKLNAKEDVVKALSAYRAAETSLGLANDQLTSAQAAYDQEFQLYQAQEATSLDLAATEAALADARRAVNEETLNRALAVLRVFYASGEIKQVLGVTQ